MRPVLVTAAIVALCANAAIAAAQSGMATAPADRSTGPTVPAPGPTDTRPIDQSTASAPSSPGAMRPPPDSQDGSRSSVPDAGPDNPSDAPRPGAGHGR
jgi:hypothetical protein